MPERRAFTPEFRARAVLEGLTGVEDGGDICQECGFQLQVLFRMREQFLTQRPRPLPSSGGEA